MLYAAFAYPVYSNIQRKATYFVYMRIINQNETNF